MKCQAVWLGCVVVLLGGCSVLTVRSQSPDDGEVDSSRPPMVGDYAVPFGMFPVRVESVGLVTGLNDTGSDPAPSPQRAALLEDIAPIDDIRSDRDYRLLVSCNLLGQSLRVAHPGYARG